MTPLFSTKRILLTIGLLALLAQGTYGHTYLSTVILNNEALGEGDCVRPHPPITYDDPIVLVSDPDMTCGWLPYAAQPANRKCPIAAGSTIGIQWHHNNNATTDDIIDPSHKGPVLFYLANSNTGSGNVWFKIYEDGYTPSNEQWAVDRLLANGGRVFVQIPSDIAPGNYLLRGEILALHNAYNLNGVQPYVGCVELTISGSGSANPAGVDFPGAYSPTDPGILVNIYNGFTNYTIPGPPLYTAGSSSMPSSSGSSTDAPTMMPTSNPTQQPTNTPTQQPTSAPSSPGDVKLQMNSGSNVWWFAVAVTGGSQVTSKVELKDSGSVSSWETLTQYSYGFVFSQSVQLTLPISLRLTSSSGNQIVLNNIISSWTSLSVIDTGADYTASLPTSLPTVAPTSVPTNTPTSIPTIVPTIAPTSDPSSVTLTQHPGSSEWWFAVAVGGVGATEIASVELKDSGSITSYAFLTSTGWGYYTFETTGTPLVPPLYVRVTFESGQSVTGTIDSISPGAVTQA